MRATLPVLLLLGCSPGADYRDAVKAQLRDPNSAEFSSVASARDVTCGFVNSKNGFGGYAGKVPFIVEGEEATVWTDLDAELSSRLFDRCPHPVNLEMMTWTSNAAIAALKATE